MTTILFTSVNFRFFLGENTLSASETQLSLVLMAMALLIASGVVVITSYVVKMVKSQAAARLEVERLRSKADLADSLREMRHDFDNQLTVVLALLQLGRVEGAVDYLHGIVGRKPYLLEGGGLGTLYPFLAEKSLEAMEREIAILYDLKPCQLPEVPMTRSPGLSATSLTTRSSSLASSGRRSSQSLDVRSRRSLVL